MPRNYLPGSDTGLLYWSYNFAEKLVAPGSPGSLELYGVTAEQAAGYRTVQRAYALAYQLAKDPRTRGPVTVMEKNLRRAELVTESRKWARVVMAHPGINNERRIALGLNPQRQARRRVPKPDTAPFLQLTVKDGGQAVLRLLNRESTTRHGRPPDVSAATVFWCEGERPAKGLKAWAFYRSTTKTCVDLKLKAPLRPGTLVWFVACWENTRCERGPMADPVSAMISFGGLNFAA